MREPKLIGVAPNSIDSIPELAPLRRRAARFLCLLWAHVPLVVLLATMYRTGWLVAAAIATGLALAATVAAHYRPVAFSTRAIIAGALAYFFAVFAILAAFCDWRPIAISAILTSAHHLALDAIAPATVFPSDDGVGRVALHASVVFVAYGVLVWIIVQLRTLLRPAAVVRSLAEERLRT